MSLAGVLLLEVHLMGSTGKILNFALMACVTCTSAYADAHGRPAAPSQHVQAPKTTGKPTSTPTGAKSGSTTTTSGSTSTSSSTTTTTPLNPIAAKIASKPQLNTRLTAMLPKDMTLNQASMGFKNQGQFIAALHVSQNLGCDCFKQIQTDMTKKGMSLGQAIQDVKKTANSTVEAQKAETEANDDLKGKTTTSTSTSTGKNKKKPSQGSSNR
jgi:hypothetical protein